MNINRSKVMAKALKTEQSARKKLGSRADKVLEIENIILAAPTFKTIKSIRSLNAHPLEGGKGHWGLDINKNWRLIVKPQVSSAATAHDVDASDTLEIVKIEDYH